MTDVTEKDVELAERYITALERIKELEEEVSCREADVELAERYEASLKRIKELREDD